MKVIRKDKLHESFGATLSQVETVSPGETFKVETHERFSQAFFSSGQLDRNVTGPVYLAGARPGQVLQVDILDVEITSDAGYIVMLPGEGPLKRGVAEALVRRVPLVDGKFAVFRDDMKLPIISPMIGKIGVAPSDDEGALPSGTVGAHGGNMDNNHIVKGATVYLPIFVQGALLSLGDCHALQGDGESGSSALEITADVTLRCDIVDHLPIKRPLVVSGGYLMTVADGKTLDEAVNLALQDMADLMVPRLGLSYQEVAMLISLVAETRVCEIVNPRKAAKVLVPTTILSL